MKINGIELHHLPVTLKNELLCKSALYKAREFTQSKNIEVILKKLARLRSKHEELQEFIDELGMLNANTVIIYAQRLKDNHQAMWMHHEKLMKEEEKDAGEYVPMTDEVARSLAEEEIQSNLKTFLKDNLEVGKSLYFDTDDFPTSIEALKIGIDIIKDVADTSNLTEEEVQKIQSPIDSEYWQNVGASEVAQFINKFCADYK